MVLISWRSRSAVIAWRRNTIPSGRAFGVILPPPQQVEEGLLLAVNE